MKTHTLRKSFVNPDQTLSLSHQYRNGVYYHLILTVREAMYAEHIRDICIDHFHPFFEELAAPHMDSELIERLLEDTMHTVNHQLTLFAERMAITIHCAIDGGLLISHQGQMIASLIGQSSLIVCRDDKAIYSMGNTHEHNYLIDQFTDYISGQVHMGDSVLIMGYDHTMIFHQKELDELAHLINEQDEDIAAVLESMITQRIDAEQIGCMSIIQHLSPTLHIPLTSPKMVDQLWKKMKGNSYLTKIIVSLRTFVAQHTFIVSIGILGFVVLIAIISTIRNATSGLNGTPSITNADGTQEVVTIQDIKKDISYFQNLDPTSNEKGKVYQDITQKLAFLESQGKRPEDVKQLQKLVKNKYYESFRIVYINQLDDPTGGEFQSIYPFSSLETKVLGTPINFFYERGLMIAGDKGAIIKGMNKDIKGTAVSYSLPNPMEKCSLDISRSGLYCFDNINEVYRITQGSVQAVQGGENVSLPTDIQDIGVFGRNNLYLLINPASNGGIDVIKRLRNDVGSFTVFGNSIGYGLEQSGAALGLSSMAIDGTFLARDSKTSSLYQLWRDSGSSSTKLNKRIIELNGGETKTMPYGKNIKVIAPEGSTNVYLFDRDNQTFTVYKSNPLKTNTAYTSSYKLVYVMRYNFDLTSKIIDVAIPNANSNKPILYAMTAEGIFQANLDQTIMTFEAAQ